MKQNTHLLAQVEISDGAGGVSSRPQSAPRRTSKAARSRPTRTRRRRSRVSPPATWKSIASRTGWPLMATIRSPGTRPGPAAGVRGRAAATTTPDAGGAGGAQLMSASTLLGGARGRVDLFQALDDVLQPRGHREQRRDPGEEPGHAGQDAEVERDHRG